VDARNSIIRNRKTNNFTLIENAMARSKDLSHQAKGLLLQMLSYPDNWGFNLKHLASNSKSGLHATRSAFNELMAAGYVTRVLTRTDGGILTGYEYTVFETPTVVRFSDDGESDNGKPHATNTELTNTETTKRKYKEQILVENAEINAPIQLSATPTRVSLESLLAVWNENCGVLPRTLKLNAKRADALNRLQKELGAETTDLLRAATMQVASDEYWIEKGYGFDNLLRDGRVVEKAEKYAAYGGMTSSDRRMANTAMTIMRAIGVDHVN
jgi:hypothetical protein